MISKCTPVIVDQVSWGCDEWRAVAAALGSQASFYMTMLKRYPDDAPIGGTVGGTAFDIGKPGERRTNLVRVISNDEIARVARALAVEAAHAAEMAEHEAERVAGFLLGRTDAETNSPDDDDEIEK